MSQPGKVTVAVTGLNATDNPGPGVSVIRSLRAHPDFEGQVVGLAYDVLDPGNYARDVVDRVCILPYPSQGPEALAARLEDIQERAQIDVLIPTLDAELASFIAIEDRLAKIGIRMFLPTREQLDVRSKVGLQRMGAQANISVPKAKVVHEAADMYDIHKEVEFPFFVKGLFYGAVRAASTDEAVHGFHKTAAQWGLPVIVQESIDGDELNVLAVGDGNGGMVGALSMRKTTITDKGKGWAGITMRDPDLMDITERFMQAVRWRGPCELEVIKATDGAYYVLEINPRFPAWSYLSAGAGMNLPYAVVQLALGREVGRLTDYEVGTMFVRISLDQIARLADFQQLTTTGELVYQQEDRS